MYICKNCYLNLIWSVVHVTETTEKNNLVITDMYYIVLLFDYYMRYVFFTDHRFMGADQRTQGGDGGTPLLRESGL